MGWWFLRLWAKILAHADAQLKAGGTFIYNRNGRFHTTDRLFV